MSTLSIDTYSLITALKDTGIPEQQAKAQIDAITQIVDAAREQIEHDHRLDDVATKRDIRELELKIELAKSELKRDIAETKSELIRWVVAVGVLQMTVLAALILKMADKI